MMYDYENNRVLLNAPGAAELELFYGPADTTADLVLLVPGLAQG